jgi:hypothetical protein
MGTPTVTAQQVYNIALGLMKETDSTDYSNYAIAIMTTLQNELYPYSDTYEVVTGGTRPTVAAIVALTDTLQVDDFIAQSVLPYGLAAHLLLGENDAQANFFQQRYDELKINLAARIPSSFAEIDDV